MIRRIIPYVVAFVVGSIVIAGIVALAVHTPSEDRREVRQYGHLECVYNYNTDKIESCAEVRGG